MIRVHCIQILYIHAEVLRSVNDLLYVATIIFGFELSLPEPPSPDSSLLQSAPTFRLLRIIHPSIHQPTNEPINQSINQSTIHLLSFFNFFYYPLLTFLRKEGVCVRTEERNYILPFHFFKHKKV